MVAAHGIGLYTTFRALSVKHLSINRLSLVDTGVDIVVPTRDPNNLTAAEAGTLPAAKGTNILM